MTYMPRNKKETSHLTILIGKWESIRHFPYKLLDQIKIEAIKKKQCCNGYGEKLHSNFIH